MIQTVTNITKNITKSAWYKFNCLLTKVHILNHTIYKDVSCEYVADIDGEPILIPRVKPIHTEHFYGNVVFILQKTTHIHLDYFYRNRKKGSVNKLKKTSVFEDSTTTNYSLVASLENVGIIIDGRTFFKKDYTSFVSVYEYKKPELLKSGSITGEDANMPIQPRKIDFDLSKLEKIRYEQVITIYDNKENSQIILKAVAEDARAEIKRILEKMKLSDVMV